MPNNPPVPIFDGTNYVIPSITFPRVRLFYEAGIWAGDQDEDELPDEAGFKALIQTKPGDYLMLNIEQWRTSIYLTQTDIDNGDTDESVQAEVTASMNRLITMVGWAKEAQPDAQVGIYGQVPVRDYFNAIRPEGNEFRARWKLASDFLAPLAAAVDYVAPSIYTFDDDETDHVLYAQNMVAEAKQYGKPVYAMAWPRYHGSAIDPALAGELIDGDYWRLQLQTLADADVDAVIIWDVTLDDTTQDTPWVVETRSFFTGMQLCQQQ